MDDGVGGGDGGSIATHVAGILADAKTVPDSDQPCVHSVQGCSGNKAQLNENKNILKRCSRLHGRIEEQRRLLEAYRASRNKSSDRCVVSIISGSAGTGKSALIDSLKEHFRKDNGTMIHWVCDRQSYLNIAPGFAVALRKWTNDMLLLSKSDIALWNIQIMKSLDKCEIAMLVKVFPFIVPLFNPEILENSEVVDQEYRYGWSTIRKFLRGSCSWDFPLIFVVDDFHWVEETSIRWIMERLNAAPTGAFFILSYNSDFEDTRSAWFRELEELKARDFDIVEITLENLDHDGTHSLVNDILDGKGESIDQMSYWIHEQTHGNPLFILEVLNGLHESAILSLDATEGSLTILDNEVRGYSGVSTVCEYLTVRLKSFSKPIVDTLKVAACLGFCFDATLVSLVVSGPVESYLRVAEQAGMVEAPKKLLNSGSAFLQSQKEFEASHEWQFSHNTIQEAVLCIVGERAEQEKLQLTIGRKLITKLSDNELEGNLLTVMGQVIRGAAYIKDAERHQLAHLALRTARKAVDLASFESAKKSIDFALSMIHETSWREDYDLTLAVYNAAAEVSYAIGNFDDVEQMVAKVFQGGRSFDDKLQANLTKMYALATTAHAPEALLMGLSLLKELGVIFPANPRIHHVLFSLAKTRYVIRGKSDDDLLLLPNMNNTRSISAMQIMNLLVAAAFFHKPLLVPLLAMRMVQLSLDRGLCAVSSVAFALYGTVLIRQSSTRHQGARMGGISFKVIDRFRTKAWIPRVHAFVYGHIYGWTQPLRVVMEPLLRGYRVGLETGDIEFASANMSLFMFFAFELGKQLEQIEQDYNRYVADELVAHHRKNSLVLLNVSTISSVRLLMGKTTQFESSPISHETYWEHGQKVKVAVIFCQYENAVKLGRLFLEGFPYEGFDIATFYWLVGIANMALFKETGMRNRLLLMAARRCLKKIDCICSTAVEYCLGKLSLLQAELSSISSRNHRRTVRKFLISIGLAESAKNPYEGALAHERYGRYLSELGDAHGSLSQLRISCSLYLEWNAYRKVETLREEIEQIVNSESSAM